MEIAEYQNVFNNEEGHFFYVSLHRLILKLIARYAPKRKLMILDAGCGTGGLMKLMKKFGKVEGVDFSPDAIRLAKRRGLMVSKASVEKLPFKARTFDLVTCIDVLYHRGVKSDVRALKEIKRVLKKGGVVILRFQADKKLKSTHDRFVHSKRRYDLAQVKGKLNWAGFKIVLNSYLQSPLWPVAKLRQWSEKLRGDSSARSGVVRLPIWLNRLMTWVLDSESDLILNGWRPVKGLGIVAVARKP